MICKQNTSFFNKKPPYISINNNIIHILLTIYLKLSTNIEILSTIISLLTILKSHKLHPVYTYYNKSIITNTFTFKNYMNYIKIKYIKLLDILSKIINNIFYKYKINKID